MTTAISDLLPSVTASRTYWYLIEALLEGTGAMRELRRKFMPQRTLESDEDYNGRLAVATLYPAFTQTLRAMTGRVFAKPLTIGEDVPGWIQEEVLPDMDMQGQNVHVFARKWFAEALAFGLSHVLVDSPVAPGVATQADQKAAGARPYCIPIHPRRILGWKTNDAGELTQVRIMFQREEEEGEFGTTFVEQIRVYELDRVRTFEKAECGWVLVEEIPNAFGAIPLVTFYTGRTQFMHAIPPLLELAFLNAKHWAIQSSNDALVDTASVPILAMTGVNEGDQVVIGAKHAVRLPLNATMQYVEHTGAAINAGRDSIKALEEAMKQAGARLVETQANTAKTASQVDEEASRDNSSLGAMVRDFEDTLANLLDMIARWRGVGSGGKIALQANLDPDPTPANTLTALIALRNAGALSDETLFSEGQRRGLIASDIEWEDEAARIAAQGMPPAEPPPPGQGGAPPPAA